MLRKPCSKCGSMEYPKYRRILRRNGKVYEHMAGYCVKCNREDDYNRRDIKKRSESHRRWAEKNKEHLKEYLKNYRNTEEYRRKKREYYHKSKINNV